jgi:hypothetical protein
MHAQQCGARVGHTRKAYAATRKTRPNTHTHAGSMGYASVRRGWVWVGVGEGGGATRAHDGERVQRTPRKKHGPYMGGASNVLKLRNVTSGAGCSGHLGVHDCSSLGNQGTQGVQQAPTAQHSTAQHSTAQHSTAQHSTAQHSTAQHSTAQHAHMNHNTLAPTAPSVAAQVCLALERGWGRSTGHVVPLCRLHTTPTPRSHTHPAQPHAPSPASSKKGEKHSLGQLCLQGQHLLHTGPHAVPDRTNGVGQQQGDGAEHGLCSCQGSSLGSRTARGCGRGGR